MGRVRIELRPHLSTEQLRARYRACRDAREKARWRALHLVSTGVSGAQAARKAGRSSGWITRLARQYNQLGPDGVRDQRTSPTGPKPLVTGALALELEAALAGRPADGGLWTAPKVADWILERTGVRLDDSSAWRTLKRLDFSLQVPRPQHARAATSEQTEAFKKSWARPSLR